MGKNQSSPLMYANVMEWVKKGGQLSLDAMRPVMGVHQNAILRKEEWELLDDEVLDVAHTQLNGVADLINAGLTHDLGGLGTLISSFERISDMDPAEVSMSGVSRGERDRQDFDLVSYPVPVIFKEFQFDIRHLMASRNRGEGLDVSQSREATRLVTDKIEDILFNGHTANLGGNVIYGYTTHPNRNNDTAANYGGGDWGTGGMAYKTLKGMMKVLRDDGFPGPYGAYVAPAQYDETLALYGSLDNNELGIIKDRLPDLSFVKPSYKLAAGNVLVVSMQKDVVDLGVAEGVQPLQWSEIGGWILEFRIFAAMVPRIKADKKGQSGIAHATGA